MLHDGARSGPDRRLAVASLALTLVVCLGSFSATGLQPSPIAVSTTAGEVRPGDMLILSVDCVCAAETGSASASIFRRPISLYHQADNPAWRAFVGIDLETRPGTYKVLVTLNVPGGPRLTTTYPLRVVAREFPTRRLSVAPGFVNPPVAVHQRIADEAAELQSLIVRVTAQAPVEVLQAPLSTPVTSNFGARSVYNGEPRSPHAGVDYSGNVGTPVLAPGHATVALAADLYFTGRTVVLDHGQGLYSILAHLSAMAVQTGARVERGAVVGALGATGRVTGPHLHWGMRLHGARIDPLSVLHVLSGT
jgi:murein DD-endopeptidase MepM/ murein hydrolase activator NlpD